MNGKELYDLDQDPAEARDVATEQPGTVRQLRASYEAWFADVGRQGYAPPRIVVHRKTPVLLTRQDFRGPEAAWTREAQGHWEVDVREAGPYEVTLLFDAGTTAETLDATWLGQHQIQPGQTRLDLKGIRLPLGKARFEAQVGGRGLKYAWFH